jgi:carbon monoxide dehydrogenase subunit G
VVVALVASSAAATELTYQADIRVKGRLAILGEMVLRATAGMMIGEVTRCLRSQLEPPSATLGSTSASS